jgi:thiol-disulfide isomerase/thioredoxin
MRVRPAAGVTHIQQTVLPSTVSGDRQVPDAFAGEFAAVLFYRGSWCPYCNAQLRAFQRAGQALADAGIGVAALSVEGEAAAAELATKHVVVSVYSSGAIGRLVPEDVIGLVRYLRQHSQAATS